MKQCGPDDFISTDIFKFWLSTAQSSLAFISLFLSAPLKSRRKHDRGLTPSGLHFHSNRLGKQEIVVLEN